MGMALQDDTGLWTPGAAEAPWLASAHVSAAARVAATAPLALPSPPYLKKTSLDGSVSTTSHLMRLDMALPPLCLALLLHPSITYSTILGKS
jgi:hypothetical protein